ncbi:MAG: MCE family protein [Carbonactinosporaceae bacterium]
MLMPRGTRRAQLVGVLKLRLYGLVFLTVIALLLALTVAIYQKAFEPVVHVALKLDKAGTQLFHGSDVKMRGIDVGRVEQIRTTGQGATVDMALIPEKADLVPANVRARLLPKTLFGERYVSLVAPDAAAVSPLQDGDVIGPDRSQAAIELQKVFADLLPLLRTVQPAKLNATLSALATALSGRGDQLGENLVRTGEYLQEFNPHVETFKSDISGLADWADTYHQAAPDLIRMLRNLTTTHQTVLDKQRDLATFYQQTAGTAATGRRFLVQNEQRIIKLANVSEPTLTTLAQYSPEYPCLLGGLADFEPRLERAFSGGELHISLEVVRNREAYQPGEEPQYVAGGGPDCQDLPNASVPAPDTPVADGSDQGANQPGGSSPDMPAPPADGAPDLGLGSQNRPVSEALMPGTDVLAGTAAEQQVVASILAPVMRVPADEVPDIATLLFGPMARGTAVSVQ